MLRKKDQKYNFFLYPNEFWRYWQSKFVNDDERKRPCFHDSLTAQVAHTYHCLDKPEKRNIALIVLTLYECMNQCITKLMYPLVHGTAECGWEPAPTWAQCHQRRFYSTSKKFRSGLIARIRSFSLLSGQLTTLLVLTTAIFPVLYSVPTMGNADRGVIGTVGIFEGHCTALSVPLFTSYNHLVAVRIVRNNTPV